MSKKFMSKIFMIKHFVINPFALYNHRFYIVIILLAFSSVSVTNAAEDPIKISFGAKLQLSTWEGNNTGNQNADFDSNGNQFSLSVSFKKGRLFGGVNFQGGTFDFSNGSPNRVRENGSSSASNATIERGEFDLLLGYYFWDQISLFLDIKSVTNDWQNEAYSLKYGGLGFGVMGFHPLSPQWTLFGSVGWIGNLDIEADGNSIGDGKSSALELGGLFRINDVMNFTIGVKSQHQEYEFNNQEKQTHDIGGLVIGFTYQI